MGHLCRKEKEREREGGGRTIPPTLPSFRFELVSLDSQTPTLVTVLVKPDHFGLPSTRQINVQQKKISGPFFLGSLKNTSRHRHHKKKSPVDDDDDDKRVVIFKF